MSDSCSMAGDPLSKCIYTPSQYFQIETEMNQTMQLTIQNSDDHVIVDELIDSVRYLNLTMRSLGCSNSKECNDVCMKRGGVWNGRTLRCNVTEFLDSVCFRVMSFENSYLLDNSSLIKNDAFGCFSSTSWSPYHYSRNASSTVSISVCYVTSYK